ncbi:iron-containing alcohol dehydrogenase family protein [Caldicellulosiruptor changbaiensis]|uniref:iron-containing alcohol dehydrogenase family protein n=1 Tax=Caldicellulosiruptor changbaiensis TaxID=1222016 RepID=UPI0013E01698|nr:iron-containing alcohol dehydrogenase family protein [Caldicellulosiruptor changbaiensis]
MNINSFYYIPTKIIFGQNCIMQNPEVFSIGKKAFIITGKSSRLNGSLQDVEAVLEKNKIEYEVFDGVKSNPDFENVDMAAEKAKKVKADFIIAIGGGSVIDAAKAVAAMVTNGFEAEELFSKKISNMPLPIIAIPTTAGTGSEVTPYSILTSHKDGTKKNFYNQHNFPVVALLDPRYTLSLSYEVTVDTMLDAFSHLVEGYFSKKYNILYQGFVENGLKYLGKSLKDIEKGTIDIQTREMLLFSSLLGGIVIAHTGTSFVHAMGYPLTYYKDIPHGRANGILISEFLRFYLDSEKDKVLNVLGLLGLRSIEELENIIDNLIKDKIVILKFTDEELKHYTTIAFSSPNILNSSKPINETGIYEIYKRIFLK